MNSDDEIVEGAMMSPVKGVETPTELNFHEAIDRILDGKKVTKLEWNNDDYCFLKSEIFHIHTKGADHRWIISEADAVGTDWVVKNE